MNPKVVPLRPQPVDDADEIRPRLVPRVISHPPGMAKEEIFNACKEHEKLILKYEARLTAMVAKAMVDKLPPIEQWVGAVLTVPDPEEEPGEEDVVELAPRDQAIEIAEPWASIREALKEKPPVDRLDVVVEHSAVIGLVSMEVEPALPVTRKQAEAANLPAHLLFAKGEAFASVGEEPADGKALLAAFEAHRALLEESSDELLERLRTFAVRTPLEECTGVVLALGPEGNATSFVTREQARRLVVDKPFLQRRLERRNSPGTLGDGRDIVAIPIVIWAKGHVSVQSREIVEME